MMRSNYYKIRFMGAVARQVNNLADLVGRVIHTPIHNGQQENMPSLIQSSAKLRLRLNTLEVSLASSFAEIDAAMRLRFEVFNLELMEGLVSSYDKGYDSDAYDAYCDHLIVKDL